MLTQLLVAYLVEVIVFIANFLPASTPGATDSNILNAIAFFFTQLHKVDTILPMDTFFQIVGIIVATEITLIVFDMVVFIYKRIRG